ncbi:MAG: hypothetical protein RL708_2495 [Bacteroidota bacterium]|jgi:uncharacterized damage-inducible protein DinB
MKPTTTQHQPYFKKYIDYVEEGELTELLMQSKDEMEQFVIKIPVHKAAFKYAENKWTIKQVLMHIIDCERIFAYRALCIARGEKQNLLGFEEDDYATQCYTEHRNLNDIVEEFLAVRQATIQLYKHIDENELLKIGMANKAAITPNAIGYIIIGHQMHHLKVIAEKYL